MMGGQVTKFARDKGIDFSSFDGRYSYPSKSTKELETRLLTDFKCCLCQKRSEDIEVHRTSYLGEEDTPGKNMFALCQKCHDEAHEADNWNSDLSSIWSSHQVEGFSERIKLGLNFLTQNIDY
ncbi:MAG: HNH endonuclease [Moorea sp. SIO4G2]|nr:HNH endonuclease [Moorena sp. SIO4G2]